jgi:hypothetical protein
MIAVIIQKPFGVKFARIVPVGVVQMYRLMIAYDNCLTGNSEAA